MLEILSSMFLVSPAVLFLFFIIPGFLIFWLQLRLCFQLAKFIIKLIPVAIALLILSLVGLNCLTGFLNFLIGGFVSLCLCGTSIFIIGASLLAWFLYMFIIWVTRLGPIKMCK